MIVEAKNLSKTFGDKRALEKISCRIKKGCIYGLTGSNGAGKSTLMRLLCGILFPDEGTVLYSGKPVSRKKEGASEIIYVMDEPYFLPEASLERMGTFYEAFYHEFDRVYLKKLIGDFKLDAKKPIQSFSKGMKRQAATILALACRPKVLLLDETFDGLDPVMRRLLKRILCEEVAEREMAVIITSHSMRELEDICDHLMLLHQGKLVLSEEIDSLKTTLLKIQVAYKETFEKEDFKGLDIKWFEKKGSVATMIVRGEKGEVVGFLQKKNPLLMDILPLSLEEIFIYELEWLGYLVDDSERGEYDE